MSTWEVRAPQNRVKRVQLDLMVLGHVEGEQIPLNHGVILLKKTLDGTLALFLNVVSF